MPKGKYPVNSSVLGSRAEQQQGGRIEARRHERWRVKGSQAGRGVQGGKRDDSIISQNRTIHELSCTLYRRHREVSDVTTVPCLDRTPRNNHIRGARDYSAGRGSRGNWHALPPGPTVPGFAPLQSADVLPHVLHVRFLRFLEGLSFPRSPFARLTAGAGRALAEAPTFVCPTIWTSSCALEFSGSAGIGVGSRTATAGSMFRN